MKDSELASCVPINIAPAVGEHIKNKAKGFLKYLGPAFIVSVAYMDPGNTWKRTH